MGNFYKKVLREMMSEGQGEEKRVDLYIGITNLKKGEREGGLGGHRLRLAWF